MVLSGAPGSIYGGVIGEKLGIYKALNIILIVQIPILIILTITTGAWFLVLALFVRVLANMKSPLNNALIGENIPIDMQGKGFSIMYGLGPIIAVLITLIGGAIAKLYGLNWVFAIIPILLLLSMPLIRLCSKRSEIKKY
jgi:predicted MFS family arabinose efflux permease